MKRSKYLATLAPLLTRPYFTTKEALEVGVPVRMLSHFCLQGALERLSSGVYRGVEVDSGIDMAFEGLLLTAATVPRGVVCLISALVLHGLTDQIMREYWIAVPNAMRAPRRPFIRVVRMRNMSLGVVKMRMGAVDVVVFDKERSVVDAFRFLSDEIAIKALKEYLIKTELHKPDLPKLARYAKTLRVPLHPYLMALTT